MKSLFIGIGAIIIGLNTQAQTLKQAIDLTTGRQERDQAVPCPCIHASVFVIDVCVPQ
jgi:hypothetical protein